MDDLSCYSIAGQLGLSGSETLWVASDLSRLLLLALKNGEKLHPEKFLRSIEAALPEGTLLVPGFINRYTNGRAIDFNTLKPETGGLSNAAFKLFKQGDYQRTSDPFHSFFVKGKRTVEFLQSSSGNTFGDPSAFALLAGPGNFFLGIDISLQHSFTFAHYVEQQLHVSYRRMKKYIFLINGEKKEWNIYEKKSGYDLNMEGLKDLFRKEKCIREFEFNGIPVYLIDLHQASGVISNDIRNNHAQNLIKFAPILWVKQTVKNIIQRKT